MILVAGSCHGGRYFNNGELVAGKRATANVVTGLHGMQTMQVPMPSPYRASLGRLYCRIRVRFVPLCHCIDKTIEGYAGRSRCVPD